MGKKIIKAIGLTFIFSCFLYIYGCNSSNGPSLITDSIDNTSQITCFDVTISFSGSSNISSLCTTNENNGVNGLGVYRFVRFTLDSNQSVTISVDRTSGLNPADPDIQILSNGVLIPGGLSQSTVSNTETLVKALIPGDYVLQVYDDNYTRDSFKLSDAFTKQAISPIYKNNQIEFIQAASAGCSSASNVTLSGKVTYDFIPHKINFALDYDAITPKPVKFAVVELICEGQDIMTTNTDINGNYSFDAPSNISNVFVRVKAKMLSSAPAIYDVSVVDNTQLQSLYAMDGAAFDLLSSDIINENLHAASGWSLINSAYTSTRVAAPFAILNSAYLAMNGVININPTVTLPALRINWSVNNTTSSGSLAAGQIGSSHYNGSDIYILGAENNDTDEYDSHVIIHEWGHYFEDKLSRSDSIGGSHSFGDIIDMRVAFGEGFGNAYSAIASNDTLYRDSMGANQGSGFGFDVESNTCINAGWYSECSIQSILYDLFDSTNDGADAVNLGFLPIYNVLIGTQKNNNALTSIFSFIKLLKDENTTESNSIDSLVSSQSIDVITDIFGDSELTNNPGSADQLPIFTQM